METEVKISPDAFQDLVSSSELVAIHLQSCSSECFVYPTSIVPGETHLDIGTSVRWSKQPGILACFLDAHLKGEAAKDYLDFKQGQILFEAKATVTVVYTLTKDGIDDEVFSFFAARNGIFNGYPFLREVFSNLTMRMGLQPVMLPLVKPPVLAPKKKNQKKK